MLRDIKFFDKYYVGFQKERYNRSEAFRMLGFATQNSGDSSFKKRKETVDRWADKNLTPLDLDNKPAHGFKIVDTVSRYSTSNKFFRVEDPRGFELEINVDNLLDIIEKHTIVQGTIMEPMVWARFNSSNYLVSSNSKEYKHFKSGPKVKTLEVGMFMMNKAGNVLYRFEGRMAYNLVGVEVNRIDPDDRSYYYWNRVPRTDYSRVKTSVTTMVSRKQDKPAFVYTEYHLDENGVTIANHPANRRHLPKYQKARIVIRKTEIKDLVPVDASEVKCDFAKSFIVPTGELLREVSFGYGNNEPDNLKITNYSVDMNMSIARQTVPVLFKTKAESMEKTYDHNQLIDFFNPLKYNQYYMAERTPNYFGTIIYGHEELK